MSREWADLSWTDRPGPQEWLDQVERARLNRFRDSVAAQDFLVGVTLVRYVVGRRLGVPPGEVLLDRTCKRCGAPHGRPCSEAGHVSVSHAAGSAIVAISSAPVGVDLEPVGRAIPPDCGAGDLVDWVRKEAVLKLSGYGLRVAMSEVKLVDGRVTAWPRKPLPPLTIRDLALPGYVAALAVHPAAEVAVGRVILASSG